jgi:hypothetical protein
MALLEAQAAGIPVVSCDTRGVPDIVADGRTGLLVPYGDEAALADGIRRLLTDEALGGDSARRLRSGSPPSAASRRPLHASAARSPASAPGLDAARVASPRGYRVDGGGTHSGTQRRAAERGRAENALRPPPSGDVQNDDLRDQPAHALRRDGDMPRLGRRPARAAARGDELGRMGRTQARRPARGAGRGDARERGAWLGLPPRRRRDAARGLCARRVLAARGRGADARRHAPRRDPRDPRHRHRLGHARQVAGEAGLARGARLQARRRRDAERGAANAR